MVHFWLVFSLCCIDVPLQRRYFWGQKLVFLYPGKSGPFSAEVGEQESSKGHSFPSLKSSMVHCWLLFSLRCIDVLLSGAIFGDKSVCSCAPSIPFLSKLLAVFSLKELIPDPHRHRILEKTDGFLQRNEPARSWILWRAWPASFSA